MVTLFLTMVFPTEMEPCSMEFPRNPYGIVPWNPHGLVPWNPCGLVHGIQGGYAQIPYGINHCMIIPHGIHDVHGTTNWLRLQPTLIPWIPHGFHMD
jgi:hypothetical protein